MSHKAQMLKGLLEGCILQIIAKGETYGYQITETLNQSGFDDLNEGSVYPVLIRLEKKKYVASVTKKSSLGPRRKYFSITKEGETFLIDFTNNWTTIKNGVDTIFKDGD